MSLRADSSPKTAPMHGAVRTFLVTSLLLPGMLLAAKPKSPAAAMQDFTADTKHAICDTARKDIAACSVQVTSVTENRTGKDTAIWAFTANVAAPLRRKGEQKERIKLVLQPLTLQVMEATNDNFTVVAYYREAAGFFNRVPPDVFAAAALNPVDKVVARHSSEFFAANRVSYQVPGVWSATGVSPGSEGEISFTNDLHTAQTWTLQVQDLDDTVLKDLNIIECQVETNKIESQKCTPQAVILPAGKSTLHVRLAARRHLKNSQPAFKFVVRNNAYSTAITQLAIPFKPQPNYFLFGVTGFLFGGLIAIMVLIVRKNPGARRKMTV
jgi:hypothetical protein